MTALSPKDLANSLSGVMTGDKLRAPSPEKAKPKGGRDQPLAPLQIESWPRHLKVAFDLFGPQALYIASPEWPVSVAVLDWNGEVRGWRGGNPNRWKDREGKDIAGYNGLRGSLPLKVGLMGCRRDTVTWSLPREPRCVASSWALRRRIWTRGLEDTDDALRLLEAVKVTLREAQEAAGAEPLPWGYVDGGPEFRPERLERYVLPVARRLGIWVRSEAGLETFLTEAIKRAKLLHGAAARRCFREVCASLIEKERAASEERHALARQEMSELGEAVEPAYTRVATHPTSFPVKRGSEESRRLLEEYRRERAMGLAT